MKDIQFDLVCALLGLVGGLSAFSIFSLLARRLGGVLFLVIGLSCLTYLLLRKRDIKGSVLGMDGRFNPKSIIIVDLLFVILLVCSIFSSMHNLYIMTPAYFIFLWATIFLTMVEICLFTPTTKMSVDVLMKVLTISAAFRWVPYLSFPGIIGVDPWWHTYFINLIYNTSKIPSGFLYSSFPIEHLIVVIQKSVSSLESLKLVQLLSVSLFEVVSLIIVFGIGKFILRSRLSLVVTLIVGISDWHIAWGIILLPMSIGLGLFTLVLFLTLHKMYKHQLATIVLLLAVIILTHTIASLILLLTLASVLVAQRLYRPLFGKKPRIWVGFPLVMFYAIALFGYWVYASSFFTIQILSIERTLAGIGSLSPAAAPSPNPFFIYWSKGLYQNELDNAGMYLFYWLGILGSLIWLSRINGNSTTFYIIFTIALLFIISYGSIYLKTGLLVPERWLAFLYILMAAPTVKGVVTLSGLIKNNMVRFAIATIIVLILSILMTTDTTANLISPLSQGPRFALSTSEIYAASVLDTRYPKKIITDAYYTLPFTYGNHGNNVSSLALLSGTGELLRNGLIAIRSSSYGNPIQVIFENNEVLVTLTDKLRKDLNGSNGRILDNDDVTAWLP